MAAEDSLRMARKRSSSFQSQPHHGNIWGCEWMRGVSIRRANLGQLVEPTIRDAWTVEVIENPIAAQVALMFYASSLDKELRARRRWNLRSRRSSGVELRSAVS